MNGGLVYVTDRDPGIKRLRRGRGFTYIAPDGTTIARGRERRRLEALAIPPAYEDVWMCPLENGHLQATGRDARARKQYRYHSDWSKAQSETKFDRLVDFGHGLPRIRNRVRRDLKAEPGDQEFALAAAVSLIDRLSLRVGNQAYARENGSFGALTLRNRHIRLSGETIRISFPSKGGRRIRQQVGDRSLQRLLEKIGDLPGATLISWLDDDGQPQALSSKSLNDYLADASGTNDVTAKTFRTWAGSVAAFSVAEQGGATIKAITQAAADRLHNTRTVARNSYVHPDIIQLAGRDEIDVDPAHVTGLYAAENRFLGFLTREQPMNA